MWAMDGIKQAWMPRLLSFAVLVFPAPGLHRSKVKQPCVGDGSKPTPIKYIQWNKDRFAGDVADTYAALIMADDDHLRNRTQRSCETSVA